MQPLTDQPHATLPGRPRRLWAHTPAAGAATRNQNAFTLRVMSYNLLAENLRISMGRELYRRLPERVGAWAYRKRLILAEIRHYAPDIVGMQEVEDFGELSAAMRELGYAGCYNRRTGNRLDGCAQFWHVFLLSVGLLHSHSAVHV